MPTVPDLFEHPTGTSTGELEVDRILTAPNVITTVRALCIPLFVYLLFARDSHGWAAFVLGALGATDWVDGYVARRFNQTSTFGKMYDPTVDRLMMVVGIISIIIDGSVPLWFATTILVREVLVASWVVTTVALGAKRMNVTWWGKVGTFANMCAFPWFLFAAETSFSGTTRDVWRVLAYCAAIPGVVFSILAAGQYVVLGRQAIAEGRAERAAA
jgi:cardiolipin synthase